MNVLFVLLFKINYNVLCYVVLTAISFAGCKNLYLPGNEAVCLHFVIISDGSLTLDAGSVEGGAGSQIRRDPAEFKHCI